MQLADSVALVTGGHGRTTTAEALLIAGKPAEARALAEAAVSMISRSSAISPLSVWRRRFTAT